MTEYKMIDLGLPSGLKWADRNVGAASPEAYGDYFAWGETAPRGENWATEAPYDWANAPFNNGKRNYDEERFLENWGKWLNRDFTLKLEYDAAHAIMGGSWRMPSIEEIMELLGGTTHSLESLNGVRGMRFTSKANGNSIFIPFGGDRYKSALYSSGDYGFVWSSSIDRSDTYDSHVLRLHGFGGALFYRYGRYNGNAVRGVCI